MLPKLTALCIKTEMNCIKICTCCAPKCMHVQLFVVQSYKKLAANTFGRLLFKVFANFDASKV